MRWSPLVLTVLAAIFAAAAGRPDGSRRLQELIPTTPWATPPVATASGGAGLERPRTLPGQPAPLPLVAPAPPAVDLPKEPQAALPEGAITMPHLGVTESRWYEEPPRRRVPQHTYLERLLIGEKVEGWRWDAGEDAEALSAAGGLRDRQQEAARRLSFGFDARTERTVFKNEKGDYEDAALVGPSMRWRPTENTHFDISPLVGVGTPYPMQELVLVFGWKY